MTQQQTVVMKSHEYEWNEEDRLYECSHVNTENEVVDFEPGSTSSTTITICLNSECEQDVTETI